MGDLDAVAISFLDGWARATAAEGHGAARLNMSDLAKRLAVLGRDARVLRLESTTEPSATSSGMAAGRHAR